MSKDEVPQKRSLTLADKKAYVVKTRAQNYRASLRLEGFNLKDADNRPTKASMSKQDVIKKYLRAAELAGSKNNTD